MLMTSDIAQMAIDFYYRRMMRAGSDAEKRRWCDLMKHWIARAAG